MGKDLELHAVGRVPKEKRASGKTRGRLREREVECRLACGLLNGRRWRSWLSLQMEKSGVT